MWTRLLRLWIWSGIDLADRYDINGIKLTNTIALIATCVLAMQLPLAIGLLSPQGTFKLSALTCILFVLPVIPLLNRHGLLDQARGILIISYASYVCASSLAWSSNLNHHYFLLLGMYVCPFLFKPSEELKVWMGVGLFAGLFMVLDAHWRFVSDEALTRLSFETLVLTSNSLFFTASSLLCSFYIRHNINASWQHLFEEHIRSETLLKRTLPQHVLPKIKQSPDFSHEQLDSVSVLFADIAGYSKMCSHYFDSQLVEKLDDLFGAFDTLADKYNLTKIKTNGDEYMAVSGVKTCENDQAIKCCEFALAILACHKVFRQQYDLDIGLRIGIASGSAIAGLIGQHPLTYDVWGDTVNLASRLESSALTDTIQVCTSTYQLANKHLRFLSRGEIKVKGIGTLESYWLIA